MTLGTERMTHDSRYKTIKRDQPWLLIPCVLCLASYAILSGCGYTTKSTLPSNIKTIYIEPFKNSIDFAAGSSRNIYLPLLEVDTRNAVIDQFNFDGNLKIAESNTADLILKGELKKYERSGLRYTDNDDVQEYRVHITVSFEMWNKGAEEPSWKEPNFVGEATYFVTGPTATSEESAIEAAKVDLARRIVERTIEDW